MEEAISTGDARKLAISLHKLPEPEIKPALVAVSGLPGTGKTHFYARLAERLPFAILESDALRKTLFPSPGYTHEENTRLFHAIHLLIEDLLGKGIPVILDATNLSEQNRSHLYSIAERQNARLILINVRAPPEVVAERLRSRVAARKLGEQSDAD
ncbi:MAG: ATP-binding protein [Dehalococcoidales bacterium]|nr:ATP-binding protein [Dehalococcoidales bacterium]